MTEVLAVLATLLLLGGGALLALGFGVAQNLLAEEVWEWLPFGSARLLRAALRRLPEEGRDRYLEEWGGTR